MLATDGGLLFPGKLTGELITLDSDNSKRTVAVQDGIERQCAAHRLYP